MEDEKALETGTVVGETTDLLEHAVDELLADGVVTTSVYTSAHLCSIHTYACEG
jgi:hypothetical protein